ncbi:chaB-like protein [Catopsilia pomona nucleopolyhedrovirus]|uniref:ChaB-like protein n=1 Tax=Catopsilia pomona nucleopolyhedrovirus TaxID=1850906 RepID=A0A172WZF5_9ABAC|nr:chaB-like protein [Catopsilia pomona nucleopolyhedrovirus]ANF29729.1 chaB-like protein [Catopsilia pomona nucleopolyhedrovirus]
MLPKYYQNLPYNGKRIFEKFYDRSLEKYNSKRLATKLACCAVRKKYMYIDGKWQARADANYTDTTSTDSDTSTAVDSDTSKNSNGDGNDSGV